MDTVGRVMKLQEREVLRQDGEVKEITAIASSGLQRGATASFTPSAPRGQSTKKLANAIRLEPAVDLGVGVATGDFVTGTVE